MAKLQLLADSPFFEGVGQAHLAALAAAGRLVPFAAGARIFAQGQPAGTLYLLAAGTVRLEFAGGAAPDELQTVTHRGYPIGWSALVEPYAYRATAVALTPTRLLALDRRVLDERAAADPQFGVALMRAVIGVLGERLRATRLRLVARRYDDEVAAVRTLLEQSRVQLRASSPLHKLPLYLEHRLTLDDAFHLLDVVRADGDRAERDLAELCADILGRIRDEVLLYQRLQAIYDAVAAAPPQATPDEVRLASLLAFRRLFQATRNVVRGLEHLPARPGHIVIMNHLRNHPDNLLPNDFILTLDTHFVSSMVLLERYGQTPVRVIRRSRPDEYGHQQFYDRLGYLYTDPAHVDGGPEVPAAARRRQFLDAAAACLRQRRNLVICPEGTSAATEESPLRLRPGAFRLAAEVAPEPLIVPVAVANFDKRLTRTTTVAVVHRPFRLSDQVPDVTDEAALLDFLNRRLRPRFRRWVRAAAALGR